MCNVAYYDVKWKNDSSTVSTGSTPEEYTTRLVGSIRDCNILLFFF